MFRKTIAASLITTFLTTVPLFAATMVKEVSVEADLQAVQNANAGKQWASLSDDLKNAIVSRITDRIAEDGVKVSVKIDAVELATTLQSATGVADSKLVGQVNISSETDNTKFDAYDLTVTFAQAGPFFLPGTDLTAITTDSKEYYDTMIAVFADEVVKKLD